ncbi:MAG: UMP kinase, partial [Spirosomataceae bacterium]
MAQIAYQRILLKLSGEALNGGDKTQVIDFNILEKYALEVKSAVDLGVQVATV